MDAPFRARWRRRARRLFPTFRTTPISSRLTAGGAGALAGSPLVQAVLPYEPYYKVQSSLLGLAVEQQPLPPGTALNLGLFAADAAATEAQIEKLGAKIIGRDRSPFGPVVRVLAAGGLDGAGAVARRADRRAGRTARVTANDLTRVTVGVAADTTRRTTKLSGS